MLLTMRARAIWPVVCAHPALNTGVNSEGITAPCDTAHQCDWINKPTPDLKSDACALVYTVTDSTGLPVMVRVVKIAHLNPSETSSGKFRTYTNHGNDHDDSKMLFKEKRVVPPVQASPCHVWQRSIWKPDKCGGFAQPWNLVNVWSSICVRNTQVSAWGKTALA